MLYIVISLLVIILVIKRIVVRNKFSSSANSAYSWLETLSPFNPAPRNIYKHLSPENKGAFWSIASSVIIGVLSCWLGFSVQFFVYNSTQAESSKLAHYQIVDKFRPIYLEMYDSCSSRVFGEFFKALGNGIKSKNELTTDDYVRIINGEISCQDINSAEASMLYFLSDENNWNDINYTAKKCIEISGLIAPYLDSKNSEKLLLNNGMMLIGAHVFETLNSDAELDSLSITNKYIEEYVKTVIKGGVSPNTNLREIYEKGYSICKTYIKIKNNSSSKIEERLPIMMQLLKYSLVPMMENILIITNEFSPEPVTNKPMWMSVAILLISIFIGYMLFRIILMKFFDKKSMEPNPKMSQSDLDKLIKDLALYKKENFQYEINFSTMSAQIKQLQKELEIVVKSLDEEKKKNK